jgi:hypothetical protein
VSGSGASHLVVTHADKPREAQTDAVGRVRVSDSRLVGRRDAQIRALDLQEPWESEGGDGSALCVRWENGSGCVGGMGVRRQGGKGGTGGSRPTEKNNSTASQQCSSAE